MSVDEARSPHDPVSEPPLERVLTSTVLASIGRVLHLHCPSIWTGPQPAIVVNGPFAEPVNEHDMATDSMSLVQMDGQAVNVNVLVDGATYPKALELLRSRPEGNTFCSVPLYDALGDAARAEVSQRAPIGTDSRGDRLVAWCEWPPGG